MLATKSEEVRGLSLFPLNGVRRRKMNEPPKEFLKLWGKFTLSMWGWESPPPTF